MSSSDNESGSGEEWVEQVSEINPSKSRKVGPASGPSRDSWMLKEGEDFGNFGVSREMSKKDKSALEKQAKEQEVRVTREITSEHYKGKKDEKIDENLKSTGRKGDVSPSMSDGGSSWLRRALTRAKEQAEREGRTLEDVAAERWGSLQKLMDMIQKSDGKSDRRNADRSDRDNRHRSDRQSERRPDRDSRRGSRERENRDHRGDFRSSAGSWRKSTSEGRPKIDKSESPKIDFPSTERVKSYEYKKPSKHSTSRPVDDCSRTDSLFRQRPKEELPLKPGEIVPGKLVDSKIARKLKDGWQGKEFVRSVDPVQAPQPGLAEKTAQNESKEPEKMRPLTLEEKNKLGAKLLKAEMSGKSDLVAKLKRQLESGMKEICVNDADQNNTSNQGQQIDNSTVILTKTDARTGYTVPLDIDTSEETAEIGPKPKKRKTNEETYKLADSEKSIRDMVNEEKTSSSTDLNFEFAKMISKAGPSSSQLDTQDQEMADDIYLAKPAASEYKKRESDVRRAIKDHKLRQNTLDSCRFCIDSKKLAKHLIVALGECSYLSVPAFKPIVPGFAMISPFAHVGSIRQCDENVWDEIKRFISALVTMWRSKGCDLVCVETVLKLGSLPHAQMFCIPLKSEFAELAPMYFQKAILEAEGEWLQNKRLIKFQFESGLMSSIPKGMPYFSVMFGTDFGFAHVIEDERNFPRDFGLQVLGGILELDKLQLKTGMDDFPQQLERAGKLKSDFKPFHFVESE